jgi:stage V sporulation protein D (sporulation-specific penicillin-binding protein)
MEQRRRAWLAAALLGFAALAVRLFWIQVLDHEEHTRRAEETRSRRWPIQAPRGSIYDRNGTPIALNLKLYSVAADPKLIRDKAKAAATLAPVLRLPKEEVLRRLTARAEARYVKLRDTVDEPVAAATRKLDIAGVIVTTEWRRAYPHGSNAAGLLGFVTRDGKALGGIEAALNRHLSGTPGKMLVVLDGRTPRSRTQVPGLSLVTEPMAPGSSAVLTIDMAIQAIAEEELAAAVEGTKARGGTVVVMDPKTGEVLALATRPTFDPNEYWRYRGGSLVSPAVTSPYEPGSTFKLVTACAAVEEGVMSRGETYTCLGSRPVGKRTIKCALHGGTRGHGTIDLDHMVIKSCNVGMATVALALGRERLYKWVRRFGFGEKTNIEVAGESRGQVSPPDKWSQIQLANIGFGQGISVTPLQLLAAYCVVANGGKRVYPRLVQMVTGADGRVQRLAHPEPKRILKQATAERLQQVLEKVVTEGTGKAAAVPGRRVAGKTGTAQKPVPGVGFRAGIYIGSFVGYAPASDPRVAVMVVLDEPKGAYYGGVVAAPVFQRVCERTLAYLRVPPDAPAQETVVASAGPD